MQHKIIRIWTDANISPSIAKWLSEEFDVQAQSFYKLGFQTETDYNIFMQAKENDVLFITKDRDYINLLATFKSPPYIILLKSGNISNAALKTKLHIAIPKCFDLILNHNYHIVEIE